jgi:hypothetical protein
MAWVCLRVSSNLFFIRAQMGPFHPRMDGTQSHPRGASHLATTQELTVAKGKLMSFSLL